MDTPKVLASARPDFDKAAVLAVAAATFGIRGAGVRDLGSERDQAFLVLDDDGAALAVMKCSNAAEDAATLDMEAAVVLHARRVDPGLPLALPRRIPGADGAADDPTTRRVAIERGGRSHHIRLYDVLPGRQRADPLTLPDGALIAWGETTARLGRALRGFFHPAAGRTMLWDIQHAAQTRAMVGAIGASAQRDLVERVLDRFELVVAPAWPALRAQVIHTDLTTDNVLLEPDGRISGIVDFGDMCHSALIVDIASVLDALVIGRGVDGLFRVSRLVLDGYERITPLEPIELQLLGELLATRAAVTIAISSWRAEQGLEDSAFAERYNAGAAATIATLLDVGWEEAARRFGADVPTSSASGQILVARRAAVLGPALEPLTYDEPIEMVSAHGMWMTDSSGRRYLDMYNNVPSLGHGHPRVVEAVARQARRLNTNLRYLHPAPIELAERLVALCPAGLDTVMFVNSGSEANDLAWRMARTFTGARGGLSTAHAYHGISEPIAALSPESWRSAERPSQVETWAVPDAYRGTDLGPEAFEAALDRLHGRGTALAATILDGLLTSDGYPTVEPDLARSWLASTRRAGGLWIADEVQGGHGRTGEAMWSFERFGIVPDCITLGKPMGNGQPIGAVITRREIAQRFAGESVFFSTFGGNPVSAVAGLAVLAVLEDEGVLARVATVGTELRAAIRRVSSRAPAIGDVRGSGLAIGVEIVREDGSKVPDSARARVIKEGLRERGVLVGTTGPSGNVLKVRPPLACTLEHVALFEAALDATMAAVATA